MQNKMFSLSLVAIVSIIYFVGYNIVAFFAQTIVGSKDLQFENPFFASLFSSILVWFIFRNFYRNRNMFFVVFTEVALLMVFTLFFAITIATSK